MGLLDEIEGPRIYLDTNIFIYAVEGFDRFEEEVTRFSVRLIEGKSKRSQVSLRSLKHWSNHSGKGMRDTSRSTERRCRTEPLFISCRLFDPSL